MPGMPLACNIDSHGRRARLLNGIILVVIAVALAIWGLCGGGGIVWVSSAIGFVLGGFCIFEARAGWCALRAMGIKTKL